MILGICDIWLQDAQKHVHTFTSKYRCGTPPNVPLEEPERDSRLRRPGPPTGTFPFFRATRHFWLRPRANANRRSIPVPSASIGVDVVRGGESGPHFVLKLRRKRDLALNRSTVDTSSFAASASCTKPLTRGTVMSWESVMTRRRYLRRPDEVSFVSRPPMRQIMTQQQLSRERCSMPNQR